ncbi:alpha/beta hydrolase [Hyphomonas chukchiensis]|uniref:alpha/beta hydrolase n=1 Tax=Hyphomonas chukchiensis TaxID=1280947 RepID=UPI0030F59DF3
MRFLAPLLLVALLGACATPPKTDTSALDGTPIIIGTQHVIHSGIYGADRIINVQVPPSYGDTSQPPNVLYVLDGGLEQDFQHIAGLGQLASLSWTIEPMLIVGIETVDRQNELTPPPANAGYAAEFPTAGEAARFRAFLQTEVMPFIAAHYQTGGRTAVMGESLAGLFVVDTFLNAPDMFDDYVSISPSLWWDDRAVALSAPERLAANASTGHRLYLTMGDEGDAMQTGLDELMAALGAVPTDTLGWTYVDRRASATHATIYHAAALDALRWLYATPPYDYGPAPWYMTEDGVPPAPEPD